MAVKEVRASVANVKEPLEHKVGNLYTGERVAPQRQLKTPEKKTYYPITVTAEDDSGLIDTDNSQVLEVYETNVFPQEFILARYIPADMWRILLCVPRTPRLILHTPCLAYIFGILARFHP